MYIHEYNNSNEQSDVNTLCTVHWSKTNSDLKKKTKKKMPQRLSNLEGKLTFPLDYGQLIQHVYKQKGAIPKLFRQPVVKKGVRFAL